MLDCNKDKALDWLTMMEPIMHKLCVWNDRFDEDCYQYVRFAVFVEICKSMRDGLPEAPRSAIWKVNEQ